MKIKKISKQVTFWISRLGDISFSGQIIFVIIVLLISWSGVKSIQTNYELQKQITALKQQNDLQKMENNNLELQSEYFNSDQYLELSARQNFGLALPGEKEILVPSTVAMNYTVDVPVVSVPDAVPQTPAYQSNFQSWVNFFLHRPQNGNVQVQIDKRHF